MQHSPLRSVISDHLRITDPKRLKKIEHYRRIIRSSDCRACALFKERGAANPVPGAGRGRIMFVGHTVGREEANEGEPAVGKASLFGFQLLLQSLTDKVRVNDKTARELLFDYIYVTNATRCGAGTKVNPNHGTWKKCKDKWLNQEIRLVDPEVIVFWKHNMAKSVLGPKVRVPGTGVMAEAVIAGRKRRFMVMNHPVAIARNPAFQESVKAQYAVLAQWLYEHDYLTDPPPFASEYANRKTVDHRLIESDDDLPEMLEALRDNTWISIDVETKFNLHELPNQPTKHETSKGALQWHNEYFDLVSIQICGLEDDGTIEKTYTIPIGFVDRMDGRDQFPDVTRDAVRESLRTLLAHAPNGATRYVCMWNAGFDAPVLTRFGVDLLGFGNQTWPLLVLDGQIVKTRLNEHAASLQNLSLDVTAKELLLEGKGGGFKSHFNPTTFPLSNMSDPDTREKVLSYAGGDPEKTLLCTKILFEKLSAHIEEISDGTTGETSGVPACGVAPYPMVNIVQTGSRLRDIALPVDHQMIPIIAEMEMIGFQLALEAMKQVDHLASSYQRKLMGLLAQSYAWFKPGSVQHVEKVIGYLFREVAVELAGLKDTCDSATCADIYTNGFDYPTKFGPPTRDTLMEAYIAEYGDMDTKAATIENKIFTFFQKGVAFLRQRGTDNLKIRQAADRLTVIVDDFHTFFTRAFLYNQLNKKIATYFGRFRKQANRDGIFHPSYFQTTTSARFAGDFQNIPRGEEDEEWVEKLLTYLDIELPEDPEKRIEFIREHNIFDVRQYISTPTPKELNKTFGIMNLSSNGKPWQIKDEDYVGVFADFAAQEDRMAFALTGDSTKERLLSNPDLDTHFYNAAFCFGSMFGFDTSVESGVEEAYAHLKSDKTYKTQYRTPMKTVHYASTYGSGVNKIHSLLMPIFARQGKVWALSDTKRLKNAYDDLYYDVTQHRIQVMRGLDERPYVEYPLFGTIRHAKNIRGEVHGDEYLSVANAQNQGTSAYVTKLAMIRMRHLINQNAQRWDLVQAGGSSYVGILLQVHDEIGIICPKRIAGEVALALESAMKMIVGPPTTNGQAFYDTSTLDSRGESGWLYIPDASIKGKVLFDADAEVKRHLAKGASLYDGTVNVMATTDDPDSIAALSSETGLGVDFSYPLVLCRHGYNEYTY